MHKHIRNKIKGAFSKPFNSFFPIVIMQEQSLGDAPHNARKPRKIRIETLDS